MPGISSSVAPAIALAVALAAGGANERVGLAMDDKRRDADPAQQRRRSPEALIAASWRAAAAGLRPRSKVVSANRRRSSSSRSNPGEPMSVNVLTMCSTKPSRSVGGTPISTFAVRRCGWPDVRAPVLPMIETSERTRPGWLVATVWAIIAPIDAPTMWARSISR